MFEVKITLVHDGVRIPATIATFDAEQCGGSRARAKAVAIAFAKSIDEGFQVEVVDVENEGNPSAAFGLVYGRVPAAV